MDMEPRSRVRRTVSVDITKHILAALNEVCIRPIGNNRPAQCRICRAYVHHTSKCEYAIACRQFGREDWLTANLDTEKETEHG